MTQRSILITGCSSGIGLDAARTLHAQGWLVIASCRSLSDVERLKAEGFRSIQLDYEDETSVANAVSQTLAETGGTLDAVFNNGAYAIPGPAEDLPRPAMRAIFEANFLGWHDLTRRLMPTFRAQGHGRIIMCSSVLGFQAMPWRAAYNATKFALEGYTDTLRMELRGSGIHVSLIEPGPIRTEFRKNAIQQFENWVDWESSVLRDKYEAGLLAKLKKAGTGKTPGELGPEAVTKKLIHALTATHPRSRYYVTWPTHLAGSLRRVLPTRALDALFHRS
ncbi:MAG: SDR family NAD(P)-dependent oxidoreductase [Pseudomonadota bacterium]